MIGRLKFNIDNIVMDIIKKIPDSVWDNPNATFLDPAMGGGQFVKAIEQKLRERGYSDESIRNRVFGLESNIMRINFAVNKYKLAGNYSVADFLNWETSMKFDVIVGNPPYENSNEKNQGSSGKLWMEFVRKAISLLNQNGYMSFIHPVGWRMTRNKMWYEIYQKYQIDDVVLEPKVDWDVGINVDYYILKNSTYTTPTTVTYKNGMIDSVDFREKDGLYSLKEYDDILIKIKMSGEDTFDFENIHSHDPRRPHMSKTKKKGYIYPIQHTGAQEYWWSSKKHIWQDLKKVIVSRSGYLNPFYDNGVLGTSQDSPVMNVNSKKDANYIIRLLNSKLYKFLVKIQKTSGFNDIKVLNTLPYPKGLNEKFSDEELYSYFDLTQEEVDLIEEVVG